MTKSHPNQPTHTKVVDVSGNVHVIELDRIVSENEDFIIYNSGIGNIEVEKTHNEHVKKAVLQDWYKRGNRR